MAITASQVNELRNITGAGMMDCKKALTESDGDFDKAIEYLRKKGQKVSESRKDRDAKEGAIFASISEDGTTAVILELNCETDFVARNDDFMNFGESIAAAAIKDRPADKEALMNVSLGDRTISTAISDMVGKIGEKIEVRRYDLITGEKIGKYIHTGAQVGVIVAFTGVGDYDISVAGKDVAMQIASMNPIAVRKEEVDSAVIEREIEIAKEQVRAEGKPENMIEKIAQGKLQKFFKENTLLEQEFVKDPSVNITQYLNSHKPGLTVSTFRRFHVGY